MDVTFNCDKCGQNITIDESGVGQLVDCPKCSAALEVPSTVKQQTKKHLGDPPSRPPVVDTTKKCKLCSEKIKADAEVCPYCGSDTAPTRAVIVANQPLSVVVTNIKIKFDDMVGIIIQFWLATLIALLLLAVIGGAIFFIGVLIVNLISKTTNSY